MVVARRIDCRDESKRSDRGGGDPNNSMAPMPSAEWARRLGALLPKPFTASWSGSPADPTEYKVAARCFAPQGRLPSNCSPCSRSGFTPASLSRSTAPLLAQAPAVEKLKEKIAESHTKDLTEKSPYKDL